MDPLAEINITGVALRHTTNHENNYNKFKLRILYTSHIFW